jgi:hypothetical protein
LGGAKGEEYYITKPRWSSGKIKALGPSSGLKGKHFLSGYTVVYLIFSEYK